MALTSIVVTLWYRPPEVLLQASYDSSVDIWSIACIIIELFNLRPIFPGNSEVDQLNTIFNILGTPKLADFPTDSLVSYDNFNLRPLTCISANVPRLISEKLNLATDLISKMLDYNHNRRLTADQCLMHPWLAS